jgi:hypothetical protein
MIRQQSIWDFVPVPIAFVSTTDASVSSVVSAVIDRFLLVDRNPTSQEILFHFYFCGASLLAEKV